MVIDFSAGTTADAAVLTYPDYSVEGLPLDPSQIHAQDSIQAPYATPGGSIPGSVGDNG